MMRPAAPQHSVRLEGLILALSRTLPKAAVEQSQSPHGRREGAGRLTMLSTTMAVRRAYATLRSGLALLGAVTVAAFFALPLKSEDALQGFFSVAGDTF